MTGEPGGYAGVMGLILVSWLLSVATGSVINRLLRRQWTPAAFILDSALAVAVTFFLGNVLAITYFTGWSLVFALWGVVVLAVSAKHVIVSILNQSF